MKKKDFQAVRLEIELLESYSKQGESYADAKGRHGWRNPIRKDTGSLLQAITLAVAPSRILEIGTAHGLSALYLACGMSYKSESVLDTIEFDVAVASEAQLRMDRLSLPVKVWTGEAMEVIREFTVPYDLVFFDAQKNQYYNQLQLLLERKLIGKGSVVLADNVTDRAEECQAFLDWFTLEQVAHFIIPTECGLLVAKL